MLERLRLINEVHVKQGDGFETYLSFASESINHDDDDNKQINKQI